MSHPSHRTDTDHRRAALYTRVSTEEQAMHGVSLDAQRERLFQYAGENGLRVVDVYVDEGISARKRYTARPAFMRMLADVRAGRIDLILFIKLDRWFRSIADYYEVQAILDRHGVQWIATEEDYDTTTANGRLALNIKLAIAQDESDRTSERIKFVFSNMVKEGRVISGKTPMGYRIESKRAVIDEETAPIVRALFSSYIDHRSQKAAARELLSRFGVRLDLRSVKHMLTNRWYIGEAYGIQNWCPSLIDEETFALVGSLLETRAARNEGRRTDRVYLFSGLLYCKLCGRRMSTYSCANKSADGTAKTPFLYYRCPAHSLGTCEMRRQINQQVLETDLVTGLEERSTAYVISTAQESHPMPTKATDIKRILGKIEKLKDLYLNDLLPLSLYQKEYQTLTHALHEAEQAKEKQMQAPSALCLPTRFAATYEALSQDRKKAFWSRALQRITVGPDGDMTVTFRQNA